MSPMTPDQVASRTRKIIALTAGILISEVTPESDLREEIGLSDSDIFDVILAAEDEFGIVFPEQYEELEGLNTVEDICKAIKESQDQ